MSQDRRLTTGTPQGSLLSPIHYTLLTSDFSCSTASSCHVVKYADDTCIIGLITNTAEVAHGDTMALFRFTVVFLALTCLMMGQMMVHGRSAGGRGLVYDDDDFTERQARKAVLERNKRSSSSSGSSSDASSSSSSESSAEIERSTITRCAGDDAAAISCEDDQTINIVSADFGRRDMTTCSDGVTNPNRLNEDNCRSTTAQPEVQDLCNGMVTCDIPTTSAALGGNPCQDIAKYITVVYDCIPCDCEY
ncbi:uncharacterized protein LOC105444823 [Strongylocentrotus purpuratus]|uniref:SUEL-type lectin domain-containing protein n=1 Tax=Strongylocentrotus purpuratus TaxID=7668 RepID=A0A7M7PJW2_STRPU|nr:uncharacterized protein LOC105444823 [Strongylocentrotus purpuratus]